MADNIVPSLFGLTPETYQQQYAKQLAAEQQKIASAAAGPGTMLNPSLAPLYAQAAQRGQMMGTALGGIFGMEDPQLKMVRDVTQMRQGFDTTTPEGLQSFAKALSDKGYTDLAVQAADKANQLMKTGAEAQTAKQKIDQEKKLRDELNNLGENATDEDILRVVRKYGTPDQVMKAVQSSLDKKAAAQFKLDAANVKTQAAKELGINSAESVLAIIQEAKPLVGWATAGFGGSTIGQLPGTEGKDLQRKLDTIKANLALDKLAQMKEASKTGASGLGSLAVKELETIQATVASLDRDQSPAQLRANLAKIENHYRRYISLMRGEKPTEAPAGNTPKTKTLKSGLVVTIED